MSIEKNMNTRIQHKHDTEANWNKAVNFIPKAGELIVYDIDENYNYSRFKIGDGVRTINDLGFSETDLTGYATESYVNEGLATKQPIGDYALKSEIPDIDSAIIDVTELPIENINEGAFYRLAVAKFVKNGDIDRWICYYVNELPSIGEPVSTDMVNITAYYNAQDGEVYGYADEMISAAGGVPVGWYPMGVLAQAFDVAWGGVITDADDDDGDSIKVLLIKDYYIYQDGWCKLSFAYEKAPEFDIQWDGVIGDRFTLDMSALGFTGISLVKISDQPILVNQFIGGYAELTFLNGDSDVYNITEDFIDTNTYPGGITINNGEIVSVYDADEANAALGLPASYLTNGLYFFYNSMDECWISRLTAPYKITKIDEKFLPDMSVDVSSLGLAQVATSGNYNDLQNRPTVYTDVVRYSTTQSLSSDYKTNARNNIDVYSKSEVDVKIGSGLESYLPKSGGTMTGNLVLSGDPTEDLHAVTRQYVNHLDYLKLKKISTEYALSNKVVYGNGTYVCIPKNGSGSAFILVGDFVNGFVKIETPLSYNHNVAYGDGKFVIVGSGYAYSVNGIDWVLCEGSLPPADCICYSANKFVSNFGYSEDGVIWTAGEGYNGYDMRGIIYGNDKFLAFGNVTTEIDFQLRTNHLLYSNDGAKWDKINLPYTSKYWQVTYGGGIFVAVANGGGIICYSNDGITWNTTTLPISGVYDFCLCYGNGKFIATSINNNTYAYSEDGVNWIMKTFPVILEGFHIAYLEDKFAAFCSNKDSDGNFLVLFSTDGINWNSNGLYCLSDLVTSDVAQIIKPCLNLTASDVGALPANTVIPSIEGLATEIHVDNTISNHNTSTSAHNDIRLLIDSLTTRLNTLADSDDTTLDQMSELVAYIKSNKTLIEEVTTNKVNVSDIINDLTTNVTNKPLSAAQGVALKALIDAITVPTKVSELTNDKGYLTSYTETDPTVPAWAKASTKPTYTKSEIGLGNVDNVKQYSANNPPPYPVTSVNGVTGAITVSAVPSCTTSNNGQFLRVVNGVAAWSTIPNAEEASF